MLLNEFDLISIQAACYVIQTVAIVIGLIFALKELGSWKNEHVGSKQIDLVIEIVELSRKIAGEIISLRNAEVPFKGGLVSLNLDHINAILADIEIMNEIITKLSFMFKDEKIEEKFAAQSKKYAVELAKLRSVYRRVIEAPDGKQPSIASEEKMYLKNSADSDNFDTLIYSIERTTRKLGQDTLRL